MPPHALSPRRAVAGFTLVEVLVALLIMAVVSGMAWRGIDGMLRARDASQARMEQTLRLNTVLAQWDQDLQSLQVSDQVPPLAFDGATLRLSRRAEGGLQMVAWSLRDGRWQRWAAPATVRAQQLQENWLRSQQLLGNEPGQITTLEGLVGWQLYFYRGNGWSNAQSSGDVAQPPGGAASAPQEALPSGVRLVLDFVGPPAGQLTRDLLLGPQSP
jgi:general secretion pathway protein J